jgi:protoporphyrin/coproporphyrin ferrochelatase
LKKGVLLVNLGTPNAPDTKNVRQYLREFLMDARVLDIPMLTRWLLVNLVIAPFRAPKSAKTYQKLWTKQGSPLKYYGEQIEKKVQNRLGEAYLVKLAMRYQSPSMQSVLEQMRQEGVSEIKIVPFFPQYASATTGSIYEETMRVLATWQSIPKISFTNQFYEHPLFLKFYKETSLKLIESKDFDHVLFSYHGVPARHIRKGDITGTTCQFGQCCNQITSENQLCYRAQCFATSRALAASLGLAVGSYSTAFQSRLGKDPWLEPYTEDVMKSFPNEGKKRLLVFSAAFVADCLETTIEIGEEYRELFEANGGQHFELLPSFNDSEYFVDLLEDLVKN